MWAQLAIPMLALFLSGCISHERPNDPAYAPVALGDMMPPDNRTGAIYQAGYERSLFEDMRARRVGDILTISLLEKTQANKRATTNITKTSEIDTGTPTLNGRTPNFSSSIIPGSNSNKTSTLENKVETNHTFNGNGTSNQSNNIQGTITVHVAKVLPNGNLVVRGEKWLTLNRGDEYIRFTGIVRQVDINPDNTVDSTRVADARITYSGTGEVASSNSMGWLAKFFTSALWPF